MTLAEHGPTTFDEFVPSPAAPQLHESLAHLEHAITPELKGYVESFKTAWHNHGYQPIRKLQFEGDEEPIFDISGVGQEKPFRSWAKDMGWNDVAIHESFFTTAYPVTNREGETHPPMLANPHFGANLFGSVRSYIIENYPEQWDVMKKQLAEKPPFVDTFLHPIMPLLQPELQDILVKIGRRAYGEDLGIPMEKEDGTPKPAGVWIGELGITTETADILAKNGNNVMILRDDQIQADEPAPVYIVETPSGHPMVVFPFDSGLSQQFSFGQTVDATAHALHMQFLGETQGVSRMGASDWENIVHQKLVRDGGRDDSRLFFDHYFNAEVTPRVERQELNFDRDVSKARPATIKDGSSWSCSHENFGRWTGEGGCDCDGADHELNGRKQELYQGLRGEADRLLEELNFSSLTTETPWQPEFIEWFVRERGHMATGNPVSLEGVQDHNKEPFRQLLTTLMGLQSCAWFFKGEYERTMAVNSLADVRTRHAQQLEQDALTEAA